MKIKIKNKKANTTMIVVGIIISVLSFFVISNFIFNTSNTVVTQSDDIACRALISALDYSKMKLPFFLYKLEEKCKIDESQTINLNNKEESFKILSNDLERCFYRYGDGQKDFMSGYKTTGDWCFTCAKVKYKDNDEQIRYQKFIDWIKENPKNLGKGEKTYFNKINIVYSNEKVSPELRSEYENLKEEMKDESSLVPMISVISEQINYIDDLNGKTLDSNDKELFVVFRYDRLKKSFDEKLSDAETGAQVGAVGGMIVGIALETAAETLVTGPFGLAFGIVKGVVETTKSSIKIATKFLKITEFSNKLKELIKYSSKSIEVTETAIKFSNKLDIDNLINQLENVGKKTSENNNLIERLKNLKEGIKKTKVKTVEELINKVEFKKDKIESIEKLLPPEPSSGQLKNLQSHEKSYEKYLELKNNWEKVSIELKNNKVPSTQEKSLVKDYIRMSPTFIGAMGGAVINSLYINNNYNQYVDIMTPEQYYRLCGPEPSNYK